jgi:EEF1A lysine methyltransferase 2
MRLNKFSCVIVRAQQVDNIIERESSERMSCLQRQYDVCIDKGTYDAISLNPDNSLVQRQKYKQSIGQLVKPFGLFIITSCNWTESELVDYFIQGKINFTLKYQI